MIVTTTENIAGRRVKETKGEVFGLRSLIGGEITEYTVLLEEARRHAVDRMAHNAQAMDADAVIMMRYDSSELGGYMTEVVAYGTAVMLEPV